jgi:hypothetical protein
MKFNVNLDQKSTWRGLVWLTTAIIGTIMVWNGKSVDELLLLAAGVAGGIGVAVED